MRNFIKDFLPDMWDSLHLYQKAFIILSCKFSELRNRRKCINCGKKFGDKPYCFVISRDYGKPLTQTAKFMRTLCCSDKCFHEYWEKLLDKAEIEV